MPPTCHAAPCILLATLGLLVGCGDDRPREPPPARVEVVEAGPPGRCWIEGHWAYRHGEDVWIPGHWADRPRADAVWVPGHYVRHRRGYEYVPGHWRD